MKRTLSREEQAKLLLTSMTNEEIIDWLHTTEQVDAYLKTNYTGEPTECDHVVSNIAKAILAERGVIYA